MRARMRSTAASSFGSGDFAGLRAEERDGLRHGGDRESDDSGGAERHPIRLAASGPDCARPGTSCFAFQSTGFGTRLTSEFSACSHVTCWPEYAASRPRIASSVLLARFRSSFLGLPERIDANSTSCSR